MSVAPPWVAVARAQAQRPPRRERLPLLVAGRLVGSVEPGVLDEIAAQGLQNGRIQLSKQEYRHACAWQLGTPEDATQALNALARALRETGHCGPWRDEQLAVRDARGERMGTIERGAVRPLGLATQAVHLIGLAADGRMWVQQRSLDKANNPGMWDTLMGGMVSAADNLASAVERETWEEAGLRVTALQGLAHGGHVEFSKPSDEGDGCGYMVERIDWFRAQLPEGMLPVNQDGEVARFDCLAPAQMLRRLAEGAFTPEATLVLAAFYGW
ncbi:MAG: DUF4743 domain-containing protein [Proteobacteria bacterium]|nr:DUF4743 domain-containing protein [Pseudomonadota bacterium]